jgi:hypothetical protein
MHGKQRVVVPVVFMGLLGWLVSALTPPSVVYYHLAPENFEPGLPLVSAPFAPGSDVVSLVPHLYGAATVAVIAILIVEIGKVMLLRLGPGVLGAYLGLCLLQAALAIDVLRRFAVDWYGYLLHFFRLAKLSNQVRFPDPLLVPPPLLSLLFLMATSLYLLMLLRGQPPADERETR